MRFEYGHFFSKMDAALVYQRLREWLLSQGARVILDQAPSHLAVEHGGIKLIASRDSKKTVDMWFTGSEDGTSVHALVTPSAWYADEAVLLADRLRTIWGLMMEDAWAAVEGTVPSGQEFHRAAENQAPVSRAQGNRLKVLGLALIAMAVLLALVGAFLFLSGSRELTSSFVYPSMSLFFVGLLALTYGWIQGRQIR